MAWEWVGTTAVGIAGIFGTWFNGKQARDDAKELAKESRSDAKELATQSLSHERLMAEDARKQQRLENAYLEMLEMTEKASQWAQIAYPLFDTNPPAPVPDLPSLDAQSHVEALVRAFGSDEVLTLLDEWRLVIREMVKCDRLIKMGLEHDRQPGEKSPRLEFMELKDKERESRDALGRRVSVELGHREA
uniref:Uncharacterized protein n=1 Tax=Mycolicibacterium phage Alyssa1 TaxID=3240801 RepID=A0AB39U1P0_9CAUD